MPLSSQALQWPDWSGETAVLVATGPSAKDAPLEAIKGKARVLVIKKSWELAPWADALYGCDKGWWIFNHGIQQFKGLKFSPSPTVVRLFPGIQMLRLVNRAEIVTKEVGVVGCGLKTGGGHSGFHALNLLVQFGVKKIVLVGLDMNYAFGRHWHGVAHGTHDKTTADAMKEMRKALDACAPQLQELGVEVVNASPLSALTEYRKVDLIEALA